MKLAILLLLASAAQAVTIADTIYLPDGTLASGKLRITIVTGTFSPSRTYAGFRKDIAVVSGAMTVDLAANSTLTPAGSLYQVQYSLSSGVSNTEYWNVPTGGPHTVRAVRWRNRQPTGYIANYSGTTWTVSPEVSGIRTNAVTVDCFDSSGNEIDCAVSVHPTNYVVTASFAVSQAGKISINAVSAWSTQNYIKAITSQTSVAIPYSEHGIPTPNLQAECWDSNTPANQVDCAMQVNNSTYAVTITFATAQSGYIVLSGR